MRIVAAVGAGILLAHYTHWLAGIVAAIAVYVWTEPAGSNKQVIVLDHETGTLEAQPHDRAAQDYLKRKGM